MVVLVDDDDRPIGTALKAEVHGADTPLHRAFSCFLFTPEGELLIQQRAAHKQTWPRVWSNSCCGHPLPGEGREAAVRRRLDDELGLVADVLTLALADYRYRAELDGVVEHEICPVWIGLVRQPPRPNPEEVMDVRWVDWGRFVAGVRSAEERFFRELSPWCHEETQLLDEGGAVTELLAGTAPRRAR